MHPRPRMLPRGGAGWTPAAAALLATHSLQACWAAFQGMWGSLLAAGWSLGPGSGEQTRRHTGIDLQRQPLQPLDVIRDMWKPHHQSVDGGDNGLHGQRAGQHHVGQDPDGQQVTNLAQEATWVFNCFVQGCSEGGRQGVQDTLVPGQDAAA